LGPARAGTIHVGGVTTPGAGSSIAAKVSEIQAVLRMRQDTSPLGCVTVLGDGTLCRHCAGGGY
jgi:hypothetical protein